jgi:hypothetical protein
VDFFQVFFWYGQKNIFADLHVSGNSKAFLPLYFFFQNFEKITSPILKKIKILKTVPPERAGYVEFGWGKDAPST